MKKVFRIVVITLGVILLLLILIPVIFKSKIESVVKEKINSEIHATVDWSGFNLTFFRGFPDLSINLHRLSVVGSAPFEGDTLAAIERFELRVTPLSVFRKDIEVQSVILERPLINGIVTEDGETNWDVFTAAPDASLESPPDPESDLSISLKRFAVTDGRISYKDGPADLLASLEGFSLEISGDLSLEETELKLSSTIERMNLKMGGIRYLKNGVVRLDLLVAANLVENRYTLKENMITLNGLSLGMEGDVQMLDAGDMTMDLKYFSKETTFQTLLSLIPAVYLQDFESLRSSGSMQLDGTISGIMNDSVMPDATMNLRVTNGYFSYPDLPKDVSDVQIAANIDYRGADPDASRVNLEQFHLLLGGNPFDLSLKADHPVSDMHVSGRAKGTIDFASLQDIVPLEDISLEGRLETDLRWDTRLSSIEKEQYDQVDMDGSLQVEGMSIDLPDIPVPLLLENMSMIFNPSKVELETMNIKMGSSDLHLDGVLTNFIPYVFKGEVVSGGLNVSSNLLDINELMPAGDTLELPVVSDTIVPVPPDSLAQPFRIRIPENIDFTTVLDLRRVDYEKVTLENITGKMRVMEGVAGLEQLQMNVIEGNLTTSGWVDTRGTYAEADFSVAMEDVDISSANESFISLGKMAPMAKFCRGKANVDMQFHSLMDHSLAPLFGSINATGHVFTSGLQFYNMDEFIRFSEVLKNDKFNEMAPDEVNVQFTVREGRIIFNPFQMEVDHSRMTVSGSHGIDLTMDYRFDMEIARADLGAGANDLMRGLSLLAAGAGVKIPASDYIKVVANVRGTFNHPVVTTDLSGNLKSAAETIQDVVKEKITEEVEKAEEQVRNEMSDQAERIIAEAEAEAATLIEEAQNAGEALVREAETQGKKLMEEAGSNPLKQVAARRAAGELKRQAEIQSENMVKEARVKAEEILRNAREEAGKF